MNHHTQSGYLFLVGIGPGGRAQMTGQAISAINLADTIVGHTTYLRLIADLISDKVVIRRGMTAELERAQLAIEHAHAGRTVALISSGDSGIYGMAGLTFELLIQQGWQPNSGIRVEVIPGTTALITCAALVGAPLSHDFCAISLSDLLTPWPIIARRLHAAALADFVIALYNPSSGSRTRHIQEAQRLLLAQRSPTTPVACIRAAYRANQHVHFSTLELLNECELDMLTTVLIGNSQTCIHHDQLMITPRGYTNKYSPALIPLSSAAPLPDNLADFIATLRASHATPAQLATQWQLPQAYILELLNPELD
ncbi:precorrin-3B C(17)-methyltransferase [Rhodoferax sp. 4810]|uniref:Precorrin-3B C(17)-methyltransferase n=1 Tax=Thiospirillum jenense TaxID=1653858 RepID=A0A839H8W9_9GAMM|nr:precorrin-3B C(17)-methyltransferase [Thiospirillum jenense]MBB1073062.1 precorrin-3B C(17)-methyltransferase [Rhodoferax jenense]MBB1125010.1 precorrin-3B C(17)-methyltransferase [Thiospirillum jenense]